MLLTILFLFFAGARAVFIPFDNCLDVGIVESNPLQLQWIPYWVDAKFGESESHSLNITMYGNVSGQATTGQYPAPNDPSWNDPNNTFGKITNTAGPPDAPKFSTLYTRYDVLTYTAFTNISAFCQSLTSNYSCPLGPAFYKNANDPYSLPAFMLQHDFYSAYSFASFQSTIIVKSGAEGAPDLACISAIVTPDLGGTLSGVLKYLPVVILILVALATVAASIFSPWGSTDLFKWSSNYGRDEDLLRLVTPGFGDCLQYIQFIVLAGSLSLSYPGYYQPVVSKVSWSALMFNESFVSHGHGTQNPIDGIYVTNGTYGLDRMSQLIGMTGVEDVWAGMVIWTLVIMAVVFLLCQIGFLSRWASRYIKKTPIEDLRQKNLPFTIGNMIRIVCNYFLLPIVSLSMFQMLVTTSGPAVLSAFAAILLIAIICFAAWILRLIFSTKPRSLLFDDLPTVLLYGPLYNTYSDDAAPFALIPALLTFIRGIAIGAVQNSGIAQLVILAICEVNLILTLYAFRPFHSPTSMNVYHSFFAFVRLTTILLSVAFVPSLGVTEAPKGWIGYVILLLHAIVLIFGFFLNALQTLIEVIARRAGAGGASGQSATRGGLNRVFGMRQLSKRAKRPGFRTSHQSEAAILGTDEYFKPSDQSGNRSRSLSQASGILLNQRRPSDEQSSHQLDRFTSGDDFDSPREHGTFSFLTNDGKRVLGPGPPTLALKTVDDPYYRTPRPRRATGEFSSPAAKTRSSWNSAEMLNRNYDEREADLIVPQDSATVSRSFQGTPVPAYIRGQGNDSDINANDPRRSYVDYAVREVDFYYGVRGPALNNQPTRKLKTGPADPVGPVSSATGWFRSMLGWKTKDKGKGFEVVRSSRAPQGFDQNDEEAARSTQPYTDSPDAQADIILPGQRTRSTDLDPGYTFQDVTQEDGPTPMNSDDERELENRYGRKRRKLPVADGPPKLDTNIDSGSAIELPSRFGSKSSSIQPHRGEPSDVPPAIPMLNSRRGRSTDLSEEAQRLSTVPDVETPPQSPPGRSGGMGFPSDLTRDRLATGTRGSGNFNRVSAVSGVSSLEDIPLGHVGRESTISRSSMAGQPTEYGYVQQHRTGDRVRRASQNPYVLQGNFAQQADVRGQQGIDPESSENWPL